jgi:hypothetical protein
MKGDAQPGGLKMSEVDFEALEAHLKAVDPREIETPRMPIAVALQEASDLHMLLVEDPGVVQALRAVGLAQEDVDALEPAVAFTREAQSRWVVARDGRKPEAQLERERRGEALRAELLSAGTWNLRADRAALGTLAAIADGDGLADLVQDLYDLAELVERKRAAFEADTTFDASASAEKARSLASEISVGIGLGKLDSDAQKARDLRDRAFTHLVHVVDELRAAGRHAYRHDPRMRKHFTSRYLERKRRARAKAKAAPPTPASA